MGVTDDDNTFTGNNKTRKFYKTKIPDLRMSLLY